VEAAAHGVPVQREGEGSMRPDQADADRPQSRDNAMIQAAKRLRRKRARVLARPAGRQAMALLVANFGLIVGLLSIWAMTVNL
jgi:hypothetical protein